MEDTGHGDNVEEAAAESWVEGPGGSLGHGRPGQGAHFVSWCSGDGDH